MGIMCLKTLLGKLSGREDFQGYSNEGRYTFRVRIKEIFDKNRVGAACLDACGGEILINGNDLEKVEVGKAYEVRGTSTMDPHGTPTIYSGT